MALQKGQRLREVGQFEVAEVGQIKSAGDNVAPREKSIRKLALFQCDRAYVVCWSGIILRVR
ncbi:hypothetical protein [Xanthomonas axonopodis]